MRTIDWNHERHRTRDRLLEYDFNLIAPMPHSAGLPFIYPWENITLNTLSHQLYIIAKNHGYLGDETSFVDAFGTFIGNHQIIYSNFIDFPEEGEKTKLYFDLDEKILYYWDTEYIPVNAMLIANTIIDGGEA